MSISASDVIRALKSESWYYLNDLVLNDLPASAFRDLDFGDTDNSVFLLPSADWNKGSEELDGGLERIVIRLLFASQKFHQPKITLYKIDKSTLNENNLNELESYCECHHYDMVGITYGQTKAMINAAFPSVQQMDPARVRSYEIADIRRIISSFSFSTLRDWFLTVNPIRDEKRKNKALEIIRHIQNVYYRENKELCPINEDFLK